MDDAVRDRLLTQLTKTLQVFETWHGDEEFEVLVTINSPFQEYQWTSTEFAKVD